METVRPNAKGARLMAETIRRAIRAKPEVESRPAPGDHSRAPSYRAGRKAPLFAAI